MHNLLDPAILFFIFGVIAGVVKSNLEIPQPISRFLALYLLMALGLKGGFALAHSGFTPPGGCQSGMCRPTGGGGALAGLSPVAQGLVRL